jgi:hypothetical protein
MIISLLARKILCPRRTTKRFYAHSLSAAACSHPSALYMV